MDIGEGALRRGLERTQWEGRMERVWQKPDIYLDGAHNPASAKRLAETIRALLPAYRRLVLVIGILGDKDLRAIAAEIVPLAGLVVATRPEYSRALDVQTLAAELRKLHGSVLSAETVGEAVQTARDRASEDDLILVTGSLYVVGDARALFAGADEAGALMGLKG
jgi:dihydrofolate synthase/folylpolyglutamate synthase